METPSAVDTFSALSADKKLLFLAKFGHNLTIAARDTFAPQEDGLRFPERLRQISEIQHRVFGHILALLKGSELRYPDDIIVSIMLNHDDQRLKAQTEWAFQEALKHAGAV